MDPQRWARIESLYHAALEKERSKRPAYFTTECGDEPELRREVVSLLGCTDTELRSPVNECDGDSFNSPNMQPWSAEISSGRHLALA
jgi:hypothetical protein